MFPVSITHADVDEDGIVDLAVTNWGSNNLAVLVGDGTGSFSPPEIFPLGTEPQIILAADFNHDGHPDLVVPNRISNNVSILLNCSTTGIGEVQESNLLVTIYPNPGDGLFTIETESVSEETLTVFDIDGRILYRQNFKQNTVIDLRTLDEGIYYLKVLGDPLTQSKKLVILK